MYILYLISAVAQVIVTMLVIIMLRRRLRENMPETRRKEVELWVYSFVVVILAMFVIGDSLDPVLARLSHERVYKVLEHSPLFSSYFRSFPGVLFGSSSFPGIYLFSFLSAVGIVLALVVIVLTCFNLGRDLAVVRNAINSQQLSESEKQDLDTKIQAFQSYVYILSAVLMTSTIGTGLFFRLPLTSIAPGEAFASYRNLSAAMTVCWGVTFSLTMLTMCFYPYFRIQKDLRTLRREGKVANDTEFTRWLDDLQKEYVVYTNVKSLLTIFLPALVAVLSRFV
jgi:sterol desaturase/sphingolipid hydroxylase (fatty acid hydroxylase superfamily)